MKTDPIIKVSFLVSYDYVYLKISLPLVYAEANLIVLAIDKNRRTWNGGHFTISPDFFEWIRSIDNDHKIRIYEDDFYDSTLSPIENDSRERKMLAAYMGKGGWIIQVDTDEYFLDFKLFTDWLRANRHFLEPGAPHLDVCAFLIILYKKLQDGFLYVEGNYDLCVLATNHPNYAIARTGTNRRIFVPQVLLHQSWARSEDEVDFKFSNWGHHVDFDTSIHYQKWKAANDTNYKTYLNFHPLKGSGWKRLAFAKGRTIPEVIDQLRQLGTFQFPGYLMIKWKLKEIKRQFMIRFFGRKY